MHGGKEWKQIADVIKSLHLAVIVVLITSRASVNERIMELFNTLEFITNIRKNVFYKVVDILLDCKNTVWYLNI